MKRNIFFKIGIPAFFLFCGTKLEARINGIGMSMQAMSSHHNIANAAAIDSAKKEMSGLEEWFPETSGEQELLKDVEVHLIGSEEIGGGCGHDPDLKSGDWMIIFGTKYIYTYCEAPMNSIHSTANYYRIDQPDPIVDSLFAFHHVMDTLTLNKRSYTTSDSMIISFTDHGHHFDEYYRFKFSGGGCGKDYVVTDSSMLMLGERLNGKNFRMADTNSFVVPANDFTPGTYRLLIVRNIPYVCCHYSVVFLKCDGVNEKALLKEKFPGEDEYWYSDPIVITN